VRALSIRQPYVEEIFRGLKTSEIRDQRTKKIGDRFYIYASKIPGPRIMNGEEIETRRATESHGDEAPPPGISRGKTPGAHNGRARP
jgi:hypothetical protein